MARFSNSDEDFSEKADALLEALKEHYLCGEKLVRFYAVDKRFRAEMAAALLSLKIAASSFKKAYPLLLSEDALEGQSTNPVLVAVEKLHDNGAAAIFASTRSILLRENISKDELSEDAFEVLSNYDEIVGIKHVRYEALDVVAVSTADPYVTIRIDYPKGMHRDAGQLAQQRVHSELAKIVPKVHLPEPINLFPLINEIYSKQDESIVVELAFGTTTASLKHEKMRRRSICLRDEAYHKAGKAGLKAPIEPHRLNVIWMLPLSNGNSMPELELHSSSIVAASQNPILSEATIRKCMGIGDFAHVEERIEHYLSEWKAKAKKK